MSQEVTIYRRPETYESVNERYVQENVIEKVLVNRVEPLNRELQIFVDCVREGRPFPISQWEATMNLEICERIAQCFSAVGTCSCRICFRQRGAKPAIGVRTKRLLVNADLNSPTFARRDRPSIPPPADARFHRAGDHHSISKTFPGPLASRWVASGSNHAQVPPGTHSTSSGANTCRAGPGSAGNEVDPRTSTARA